MNPGITSMPSISRHVSEDLVANDNAPQMTDNPRPSPSRAGRPITRIQSRPYYGLQVQAARTAGSMTFRSRLDATAGPHSRASLRPLAVSPAREALALTRMLHDAGTTADSENCT